LKKQNKFVNGGRDGREEVGRRERERGAREGDSNVK
jgi:hypothetical protein